MIQKNIYIGENLYTVSKKEESNLNLFWYGFLVYLLFFVLASTESPWLTAANCQAVQILGFIAMLIGAFGAMRYKFDSKYLETLFTINLLYSVTIVLRGSEYDKESLKKMFLDVTLGILPYFASVVLLFTKNIGHYKKIFNVLLVLCVFFILSVVVFYDTLHDYDRLNLLSQGLVELFTIMLALPVGFILLNYLYHAGKKQMLGLGMKNIIAGAVMLLALFFAIFRARRGLIFMCVSSLLCVGMIYVISTKNKMLIIFLSVILVAVGSVSMSNIKLPSMFNFLLDRGDEDTRTGVEVYMYNDMSVNDWIIGKGIKGSYYCPVVDNVNDAEGSGYRDNIETGYLQIILKGGIISLALLLLMFIPAVYKGFFKSKNVLSKSAAMWIFLWIVYLIPAGGIVFNMNYLLVWISVGICYSEKIGNMSDSTIKSYLLDK